MKKKFEKGEKITDLGLNQGLISAFTSGVLTKRINMSSRKAGQRFSKMAFRESAMS
jgi:hypothetical protein